MAGSQSSTFLLSAANVSWGRRECYTLNVGVTAASLDGKYFNIDVPTAADFGSSLPYYVWFDLDTVSADPAPAGRTGIEVAVTTGDSASVIALAIQSVLEAHADFRSKLDPSDSANETAILEAEFKGEVLADAVDVDSLLTLTKQRDGLGGDLGKTSGGVEVAMEQSSIVINSDQNGALPEDEILSGASVEATMSFMEMTPARWKTIVGSVTGDAYTPSGGSELVGFGESRIYSSLFDLGGELVLHPTRYADSDRSRDIILWKSSPKPSSINFSGEDVQVMEVTFTALLDKDVKSAINLMAFGDNQQDVRA